MGHKRNFDFKRIGFLMTKKERRGIAVLSCCLLVSLAFSFNIRYFLPMEMEEVNRCLDTDLIQQVMELKNERDTVKNDHISSDDTNNQSGGIKDSKSIAVSQYKGPSIDPNTADSTKLAAIGMPSRVINNWLKYRNKGGRLYKKEDLKKIYGVNDVLYTRLAQHIHLDNEKVPEFSSTSEREVESLDFTLDINTASEAEWEFLPGIGPGYASRIVKFREQLGGFTTVDQISETWGLPDSTFQMIVPLLEIRTSHRKIAINSCTIEELGKHPYIDWKRARLIIRYREQHGDYTDKSDVLRIQVFNEAWVDQWIDYVSFEPSDGAAVSEGTNDLISEKG